MDDPGTPGSATLSHLYFAFERWCRDEGARTPMGRNKFASRLTQLPAVQEIRVGAQRTRALNVRVLPHRDWNTGATDPYAHLRPILFPHEGATP